ncbi:MAG: DUF6503 family protein [Gemmatimonadota bacterium]
MVKIRPTRALLFLGAAGLAGCDQTIETPEEIVEASIERYGGDVFENVTISWDFRGVPFQIIRDGGVYRHQRTVADSLGTTVREVMDNEGTWVEDAGERRAAGEERSGDIAMAVNSTVYLGFLPFRLDDPSVRLADLGSATVEGRPYRKVEVTFGEDGGGSGWENRFVYWFREGDWTLDYLAYAEPLDPPVTRFRRAVNRRGVGGILVQDYENYTADPEIEDIANYDEFLERGELRLISMVEFDSVKVETGP